MLFQNTFEEKIFFKKAHFAGSERQRRCLGSGKGEDHLIPQRKECETPQRLQTAHGKRFDSRVCLKTGGMPDKGRFFVRQGNLTQESWRISSQINAVLTKKDAPRRRFDGFQTDSRMLAQSRKDMVDLLSETAASVSFQQKLKQSCEQEANRLITKGPYQKDR